jgi:hypothetical protein
LIRIFSKLGRSPRRLPEFIDALVGHHDLIGNPAGINFWTYSHKTPGCAPANLQRVGGAGLFCCFAVS